MVAVLMDGTSRPAGELAAAAGVRASTASEHLAVLIDSGLVAVEPRGRHRFYRLASPEVAVAVEQLGHLCPEGPITSYRQSKNAEALAKARLCYDHLAGRLGLTLTQALIEHGWIAQDFTGVTQEGRDQFGELGLQVENLEQRRRPLIRSCPDWTERKPHLAGAIGAELASLFIARQWVRRRRSSRGLEITAAGSCALDDLWGLRI